MVELNVGDLTVFVMNDEDFSVLELYSDFDQKI